MSHPITATDLLRRARQILTPRDRWHQGYFWNGQHGAAQAVCAVYAVSRAATDLGMVLGPQTSEAYGRLDRALPRRRQTGPCSVALFNDDPGTRHEDVLRLFDQAIGGK